MQLLSVLMMLGIDAFASENVFSISLCRQWLETDQAVIGQGSVKNALQLIHQLLGLPLVQSSGQLGADVRQGILAGLVLREVIHAVQRNLGCSTAHIACQP